MTASGTGPSRRPLAAAVAVVIIAALVVVVRGVAGGDDGVLRAEFESVNGLGTGDPVRVAGVDVGQVSKISVDPAEGTAEVAMTIERDVPLTSSARATMRWRNLLGGGRYVDLDPGEAGSDGEAVERIPRSRTASQVEFDHILQPFDGESDQAFQAILSGLDQGLSDPGAVGKAVDTLAPTLRTLRRGLEPMRGTEPRDLRRLVRATSRTAAALGRRDGRLRQLVAGAAETLHVTATRRSELGQTIELSPAALDETRATARRLEGTLERLDPLVERLRPPARRLKPALRTVEPMLKHTTTLLRDARPALAFLEPSFTALRGASHSGVEVIDRYSPILGRLDDELLPWLRRIDPETGRSTAAMIGPTAAAAADAAREFDGEGHWARLSPSFGERPLLGAPCSTFLTDPTREDKLRCDELESVLQTVLGGAP